MKSQLIEVAAALVYEVSSGVGEVGALRFQRISSGISASVSSCFVCEDLPGCYTGLARSKIFSTLRSWLVSRMLLSALEILDVCKLRHISVVRKYAKQPGLLSTMPPDYAMSGGT